MYCIKDSNRQKISTVIIRKNVIRRLFKKNNKHSILNKLDLGENFLGVMFTLNVNKVCFTMFSM